MYWAGNQVKGGGERGSKLDGQERDREGKAEKKRENSEKGPSGGGENAELLSKR